MPSVFGTNAFEISEAIGELYEKLAGPDGEIWLNAFKRFLHKEIPWNNFRVWKTIILNARLRTAEDFCRALLAGGFHRGDGVLDMLSKSIFKTAPIGIKVDFVNVSVVELGFFGGIIPLNNIYRKAMSLGLKLCSDEMGPQLRIQYDDQPIDEEVRIAMEPIAGKNGDCVYTLQCDHEGRKGIYQLGLNPKSSCLCDSNCRFIFVLPPPCRSFFPPASKLDMEMMPF